MLLASGHAHIDALFDSVVMIGSVHRIFTKSGPSQSRWPSDEGLFCALWLGLKGAEQSDIPSGITVHACVMRHG